MKWPHDDTAALVSFYGDPRRKGFTNNLVLVKPPWQMTFDGKPIKGVQIHRKCAASLKAIFDDIWEECDRDESKLPDGAPGNHWSLTGVPEYSSVGGYNVNPDINNFCVGIASPAGGGLYLAGNWISYSLLTQQVVENIGTFGIDLSGAVLTYDDGSGTPMVYHALRLERVRQGGSDYDSWINADVIFVNQ